ncbi:MAG: DUF4010 domain-containing protein [Bacteroidota bacterium]|jgi:uncharacterized membrane protein (DUF4010 family)
MIIPEFELPSFMTNFVLVTVFSLIIGLSQRRLQDAHEAALSFGTDRTFTFIGMLGYILYIIRPQDQLLFIVGFVIISLFLMLFYFYKMQQSKSYGLTSIVISLITYSLGLLLVTQPFWFFLLIVAVVLIFTELKESFMTVSKRFNKDEFLTLAKFIVMAGVILPIVPNTPFVSYLSLTPYKIWMAVVVISSISYISYLLKKFVFPDSGVMLTGILGGLYSSTATTFILARKMKECQGETSQFVAAIIMATSMMYLRILVLILIFNQGLFDVVWMWFLFMFAISASISLLIRLKFRKLAINNQSTGDDKNPLEFKIAILFTILFVAFTFITHFTIQYLGSNGLQILSLVVGVSDIDPFLLNLFQGHYDVSLTVIAIASFQAIISNNVLKALYAFWLSGMKSKSLILGSFALIILANVLILFLL